jgi:hypothetical protein
MKPIYLILIITYVRNIMSMMKTDWTDPATKTYFNYSGLRRAFKDPWTIHRTQETSNSTISFNFGIKSPSDCPGIHGNVIEKMRVPGRPYSHCTIWGSYVEYAQTRLIDYANPYEGIILTYRMGDNCNSEVGKGYVQRETNFYLYCSNYQESEV